MLSSLHVKNLALIDEEEVFFGEGLNILTGETGAGKSVIIGSVNLALGSKADKDLIRTGAEYALIELIFQVNEAQKDKMIQMDLYPEEDGTLLIQRKILPTRSVCKVCGETVGAKQLQELAEILIDIYGQNDHQSLLNKRRHLEILDEFSGQKAAGKKEELKKRFELWQKIRKDLEESNTDEQVRQKEAALLRFEIQEIDEAAVFVGEDEMLEHKYRKMANSRKIKEATSLAYRMTGYDSGDGAGENVGRALREIHSVAMYDAELVSLEEQLKDIDALINDFNRGISDYLTDLEFDESSFIETENRLNLLNHLKSKYKKTLEEILVYRNSSEERLTILEDYENHKAGLESQLKKARDMLLASCGELSAIRKKSSILLSKDLIEALLDLNFQDVKFEIQVQPEAEHITSLGYDQVEFLISTNKGEKCKSLSQVASGGELSRIMLALKTVFARQDEINTLIFDEIDAGISGRTAWKVSEKLGIIAKNHQVICITHLPQIAAMADHHYLIEKNNYKDRTVTKIKVLEEDDSLEELARMLGSDEITSAALVNAKELKDLARNTKQY